MTLPYTHTFRSGIISFYNIPWPQIVHDIPIIISHARIPLKESNATPTPLPPLVDLTRGISFNDANQPSDNFVLSPRGGWGFASCHTDGAPYDLVVCTVLLRVKRLAGGGVLLGSNCGWEDERWRRARELYVEIWPYETLECPFEEGRGGGAE